MTTARPADARHPDQVEWHVAGAWTWLAVLVMAIVTGLNVVMATTAGSAQSQRPSLVE